MSILVFLIYLVVILLIAYLILYVIDLNDKKDQIKNLNTTVSQNIDKSNDAVVNSKKSLIQNEKVKVSNPIDKDTVLQQRKKNPFSNFTTHNKVLTTTEFFFYQNLKLVTDKLNLLIFPQVDMKSLIQQKNPSDWASLNKINRKSIDYTLVKKDTGEVVCCIELDDYTHTWKSRQKNDKVKNEIFQEVGIPLLRIKPKNTYTINDITKLENILSLYL